MGAEAETVAKTARAALHDTRAAANQFREQHAEAEAPAGRRAPSLAKRLDLRTGDKRDAMLQGVTDIAALPDTIGAILYRREPHDCLKLYRVSCPIGVLLVILEARPEVVVNVAVLTLDSGATPVLFHRTAGLTLTAPTWC